MPFVQRNDQGQVIALLTEATAEATEELISTHPDVAAFLLANTSPEDAAKIELTESDAQSARVLEDLIYLLIDRNLIMMTDLPDAAQDKLFTRRNLRERIDNGNSVLVEDGDTLL